MPDECISALQTWLIKSHLHTKKFLLAACYSGRRAEGRRLRKSLTDQLLMKIFFSFFTAWVLGGAMCKMVTYVQGVSVVASVDSLVAVSLDR